MDGNQMPKRKHGKSLLEREDSGSPKPGCSSHGFSTQQNNSSHIQSTLDDVNECDINKRIKKEPSPDGNKDADENKNKCDSSKKMRTVISNLLRDSECPVCMEALKYPFKVCTNNDNSHGICYNCATNIHVCPTCQADICLETPQVPVFFKNLLEKLPRMCKYLDKGCDEFIEPNENHETFCGFRPFLCIEEDCGAEITVFNISKHYEEVHPTRFIVKTMSRNIVWPEFDPCEGGEDILPVFVDNSWFWIRTNNDTENGCLKMTFEATPIGELQYDYYVTTKFEKDSFSYCYSLKAETEGFKENGSGKEHSSGKEHDNGKKKNTRRRWPKIGRRKGFRGPYCPRGHFEIDDPNCPTCGVGSSYLADNGSNKTKNAKPRNQKGLISKSKYQMSVPQCELQRFVNADGDLSYDMEFFKVEKNV